MAIAAEYLRDVAGRFRQYKTQAEQAIAQVSDEGLLRALDADSNSIAVLMRHIAGNLRSRWTDFLTTDGEKPDRHRDQEFEAPPVPTRAALMDDWETGWARLFAELATIGPADLERTVSARHEPMSVVSAMNRQLGHAALHIGQIIMLARHFKSGTWNTLTIPRGQSEQYNDEMRKKYSR